MEMSWDTFHEIAMENSWMIIHDFSMSFCPYEFPIDFSSNSLWATFYELAMENSWTFVHEFSMISMGFCTYKFLMEILWATFCNH